MGIWSLLDVFCFYYRNRFWILVKLNILEELVVFKIVYVGGGRVRKKLSSRDFKVEIDFDNVKKDC